MTSENAHVLPGNKMHTDRMPAFLLLARLGKRVLRPGGLEMTRRLLSDLAIGPLDEVVELAPGLGSTARLILAENPLSYRAVERDIVAARWMRRRLNMDEHAVVVAHAEATGLADCSASVVIGEAMLTMQPAAHKLAIVVEALRLLKPGGRYGMHEVAIVPDDTTYAVKADIESTLSRSLHVGARPLSEMEWHALLSKAGFEEITVRLAPLRILEPARLIADEGLWRTLRFILRVLADPVARRRVLSMRAVLHRHSDSLSAISIVARKGISYASG